MMAFLFKRTGIILLLFLTACSSVNYAPVIDGDSSHYHSYPTKHFSYRSSKKSRFTSYAPKEQPIVFQTKSSSNMFTKKNSFTSQQTTQTVDTRAAGRSWLWPTQGAITQKFSPATGNKGINITNKAGTPIVATASGVVVYEGQGLEGYGKLVIIKHNNGYLSAYAHSAEVFVKEGEKVFAGQKIATMGDTGANHVMLHFEIRKGGQPIDPLGLLPKK